MADSSRPENGGNDERSVNSTKYGRYQRQRPKWSSGMASAAVVAATTTTVQQHDEDGRVVVQLQPSRGSDSRSRGNDKNTLYPVSLLFATVLFTIITTLVMCVAMMSDEWEYIGWNVTLLNFIEKSEVSKLISDQRVTIETSLNETFFSVSICSLHNDSYHRGLANNESRFSCVSGNERQTETDVNYETKRYQTLLSVFYLLPMNGGIWTLCIALSENELIRNRRSTIFPEKNCVNYLKEETDAKDWNQRMQNLSIACALVCLIILGCSALIGTFGILNRQLSAILITGVMYLLAGIFGLFTLMIIHMKRNDNERGAINANQQVHGHIMNSDGENIVLVGGIIKIICNDIYYNYTKIWSTFTPARLYTVGSSAYIGWVAVALSTCTSSLWIMYYLKLCRNTAILV